MEQAIKIATDNGYVTGFTHDKMIEVDPLGAPEVYLLDFHFWQALGKGLGWEVADGWGGKYAHATERMPHWKHVWHEFIDHLAEDKNINTFFSEIIK